MTSAGRAFQTRAPVTEKARRPTVGSLTTGTRRLSEVEDRSRCWDGMSATGVNCRNYYYELCPYSHGTTAFSIPHHHGYSVLSKSQCKRRDQRQISIVSIIWLVLNCSQPAVMQPADMNNPAANCS